ncbi:hypothetical protein [Gordonia soli]|uniref:Uncharacterized protein n=1 Tax=Gordonia soli NBRC 108243 TaxID=1223545 RepID=M0QRH7_9ACTN|nr:hypothetical protein [Gordonia soli]GAC71084.1 hypothetical protein GS4_51_00220 [Gordonia soli NBRC 108243]
MNASLATAYDDLDRCCDIDASIRGYVITRLVSPQTQTREFHVSLISDRGAINQIAPDLRTAIADVLERIDRGDWHR